MLVFFEEAVRWRPLKKRRPTPISWWGNVRLHRYYAGAHLSNPFVRPSENAIVPGQGQGRNSFFNTGMSGVRKGGLSLWPILLDHSGDPIESWELVSMPLVDMKGAEHEKTRYSVHSVLSCEIKILSEYQRCTWSWGWHREVKRKDLIDKFKPYF